MIKIWNRSENCEEIEKVYGSQWVQRLYGNSVSRWVTDQFLAGRWVSKLSGLYESSSRSRKKIEPFIEEFSIRMSEFEEGPFDSFNDFFSRRFKSGMRPMVSSNSAGISVMPAFAEARYLAFEKVDEDRAYPVKGLSLSPVRLLGSLERAQPFLGGAMLIARLCPTDYHRFHFPDSGVVRDHYRLSGKLHSVNPLALQHRNDILVINERHVTLLDTENFGQLAYVEVGALCVGKIVQTHSLEGAFARGEEKGYFLFGASTVIVMGQRGAWRPAADLLERTAQGQEVFVKLGDAVAQQ